MATGTQPPPDRVNINGLLFWYFLTSSSQSAANPPDFKTLWPFLPVAAPNFFTHATQPGDALKLFENLSAKTGPWQIFPEWSDLAHKTFPDLDTNTLGRIWLLLVTRPDLRADAAQLTSTVGQLTPSQVTLNQVEALLKPTTNAAFDTTAGRFGTFSDQISLNWPPDASGHPRASELNETNPVSNPALVGRM